MKKIVDYVAALFLICALCLFVACGSTSNQETTQAEITDSTETATEADEVEDATTDVIAESSVPQVSYESVTQAVYSEDGTTLILTYDGATPVITCEGNEVLEAAAASYFEEQDAELAEYIIELTEMAEADYEEGWISFEEDFHYTVERSYSTSRLDAKVISICMLASDYACGAHGSYAYIGINLDAQTGESLSIADILLDETSFREAAVEYILSELKANYDGELFDDYETVVEETLSGEPYWYLDANGIEIIFNIYEIAPYAAGEIIICLPYSQFEEFIKSEYLYSADELGVATTSVYTDAIFESIDTSEFERLCEAYYLTLEGGRYFLFYADYSSADYVTLCYEITDDGLSLKSRLEDVHISNVNTEGLVLNTRFDILGTYYPSADYVINENGEIEIISEIYTITLDSTFWHLLELTMELPVVIGGESTSLSSSTALRIIAVDGDGRAYFRLESTGEEGYIEYEESSDELLIEGISEYEYFDVLPYSD